MDAVHGKSRIYRFRTYAVAVIEWQKINIENHSKTLDK